MPGMVTRMGRAMTTTVVVTTEGRDTRVPPHPTLRVTGGEMVARIVTKSTETEITKDDHQLQRPTRS